MNMTEVQNLTKEFNGKTVINEISFEVKEGEIFGFLGPNGAGKTRARALYLLNSLDYVSECERDDLRITAIIKDEKTSTILSALMKEGIKVEEVKNVTKSLEDIYLNIIRQSERRI